MTGKHTNVKVVVEFEIDYSDHISEYDIDWTDVFEKTNIKKIKKVKLKHK